MKGKFAFVLGAAVGYVLGSRAGRERYEQIQRGARAVWNTEPVQRGVSVVRGAVDSRVDDLTQFAKRVGADAVSRLVRPADPATPGTTARGRRPSAETPSGAQPADAGTPAPESSAPASPSDSPAPESGTPEPGAAS